MKTIPFKPVEFTKIDPAGYYIIIIQEEERGMVGNRRMLARSGEAAIEIIKSQFQFTDWVRENGDNNLQRFLAYAYELNDQGYYSEWIEVLEPVNKIK